MQEIFWYDYPACNSNIDAETISGPVQVGEALIFTSILKLMSVCLLNCMTLKVLLTDLPHGNEFFAVCHLLCLSVYFIVTDIY